MADKTKLATLILRVGLAFSFSYAALSSFLEPDQWIGWFPALLKQLIPNPPLLLLFSIYEILLAVWLLSGKKTFFAALLSAATLAGIVIFNLSQMIVVFRDLSLCLSALSLAVLTKDD